MKLELKESNSPFWVLGLDHGKITVGSFTNKPCYYKSSKKWYEFAKQIINQPRIDEVYLITGVEWDNMKGSWSAKEAGSYVQNKGKLILSKNEITTYEKKYGPIEVNEGNFPKGMSKDPLPKKGVKTYTSSATTLEGDEKMKLELKEKTNEDVYIFESNIDSEDPANAKELWDDINVVKKENGKECKIIKSSKLPGFPNEFEEMIHDIFLRGYSLEEAIENEENKKRIKNIAKTYGVEFMKIRFAEEISNSYTGTEKAYQMMKTTYSEKKYFSPSPVEKDAKHLTVRDRLVLILCLNTDKDISECEKQVDQLMRDEVLTEEELWDYLSVNVYQSKHRHSDEFRLFTAHEFVKAKGVSKNTELDSPFYWWLILAFCERGMAESIEKAFELVLKKYETRKQNERMN